MRVAPGRRYFLQSWNLTCITVTALLIFALPATVLAQAFPSRAIRVICPFSAGGSIDKLARLVGKKLEASFNVPVLVENRVGGGGVIGTKAMVDSRPDGYTIAILSPGPTAIVAALNPNPPYNIENDFTYIVALASVVGALAAAPDFPARNVKELIDYARKNPGKVTYGSSGVGSSTHLQVELFAHAAGIKMVHIPFKGASNGVPDVLGGHIATLMSTLSTVGTLINSGKLQGLYVFERQRYPTFPQVPAVTEGVPAFDPPVNWYGLAGPANLPAAITDRLNREAVLAMATPDLQKEIVAGAYRVIGGSPRDYQDMIRKDARLIGETVRSAGIKLE